MKRFFVTFLLLTLILYPSIPAQIQVANAAAPGSVVINEIAWMGTADSTSDEWIEIHNTTGAEVDLTGWTIDDDSGSSIYTITGGTVPANGYFVIEDREEALSNTADAVINLSLGNTGDSLVLKDESGQTIDTVNSGSNAWFAGDNTTKSTMERIDPALNGDDPTNWANNLAGNGATGSLGSVINGTPGSQNSVFSGSIQAGPEANFGDLAINPLEGETFDIQIQAANVTDLLSFGFDILYDESVLTYISATEGTFLSEDGSVQTSFYADLQNGTPGRIVTGGSRLTVPPAGVNGSGTLFTLTFQVAGSSGEASDISFDATSFLSDTSGDISATFDTDTITIDAATADPVTNFTVTEGTNRYSLDLNWTAPATGADNYSIFKKDALGNFVQIANTAGTTYTDSSNLIPNYTYEYQVIAVKGAAESTPINGTGTDTRGLKGDNNRSDRVDGRDLDSLARHFTLALADANFDLLIDTTYDGIIDGSDLIDIGANWALTY